MDTKTQSLRLATPAKVSNALELLRSVDRNRMLDYALGMPAQILAGLEDAKGFHEGDLPLDRTKLHLVGLGGSAIVGELLRDMLSPRRGITLHRGTPVPRDRSGTIVSSYSGNTIEIIDLARQVTGGLKTVVMFCSGGALEKLGRHWGMPVWKLPEGMQPRAAIGHSMAYVGSLLERWRIFEGVTSSLQRAASKLVADLTKGDPASHPLLRAALPIAESVRSRNTLILHSLKCTGAARRFAAQLNENSKQAAFPLVLPEAMHNGIEGMGTTDPAQWSIVFMTDSNDPFLLRQSIGRLEEYFAGHGFPTIRFPSAGEDAYETTLARVLIGDMTSLFVAALGGVDPTPIPTITYLKKGQPAIADTLDYDLSVIVEER